MVYFRSAPFIGGGCVGGGGEGGGKKNTKNEQVQTGYQTVHQ